MSKKLLIAVPNGGHVENQCIMNIFGLRKPDNIIVQYDLNQFHTYSIADKRNYIFKEALDYKFDYVLMVDSDIILPNNTVTSLMSHKKEIVFGWYPRRCTLLQNIARQETEAFRLGQKNFDDNNNIHIPNMPKEGLIEIKGGGMGCSLIDCSIIPNLKNKQGRGFEYIHYDDGAVLSEDNYFCCNATNAGYKIYLDCSIRCGHISKIVI